MAVTTTSITQNDLRIYAFTRDNWREGNKDHVYSHSPSLAILLGKDLGKQFGSVRMRGMGYEMQTGGQSIFRRVRLGRHAGSRAMAGGFDSHSTAADDNTMLARINWRHYSGALVLSEYDKAVNAGEAAMASFVEDQTESVMLSLVDLIGDHLWGSTALPNGITPVDDLVSANDSVQGLSGATYDPEYNARGLSARTTAAASISFTSGSFAAQGISDMRTCYNNASEGMIQPNVIFTDYPGHERYEGVLQPLERFQGAVAVADGSFKALAFRSTPVMADPKVPSGTFFFLRVGRDGLQVVCLEPFDFRFAPFKPGANQETFISELQWKGNTVLHNRRYGCNKMTGVTD